MAFVRDKETRKVTDPERNAILEHTRGWSNGDKDWEISWNGEIIGFTARGTKTYGGETKNIPVAIEWFIASMKIPEHLAARKAEVIGIIKEAMEVQGLGPSFPDGPVTVKFDQRLIRNAEFVS